MKNNNDSLYSKAISFFIAIILGFVAYQSKTWTADIKALSVSIAELNSQMKVVVEKLANQSEYVRLKDSEHDKLLLDHEVRIRSLEKKR